jgi:hypothetical protein
MSFWKGECGPDHHFQRLSALERRGLHQPRTDGAIHRRAYLDFDQRRKKQEAIAADQADDAELKAIEDKVKRRPQS